MIRSYAKGKTGKTDAEYFERFLYHENSDIKISSQIVPVKVGRKIRLWLRTDLQFLNVNQLFAILVQEMFAMLFKVLSGFSSSAMMFCKMSKERTGQQKNQKACPSPSELQH